MSSNARSFELGGTIEWLVLYDAMKVNNLVHVTLPFCSDFNLMYEN